MLQQKQKNLKWESKIDFHNTKTYQDFDLYNFKNKLVISDKPINLGFTISELSKLFIFVTVCNILQPFFGQENTQLHYIDFDSLVLSNKTPDIVKESIRLKE